MHFIGIDGGQSHTEVVIYRDGLIIASGRGGPSHIQGQSMENVFFDALSQAFKDLPQNLNVAAIGAGVTGSNILGKKEAVFKAIKRFFPSTTHIYIENDAVAGHWGATLGKDGASIVSGTGSIAYGTFGNKSCSLGGFGYLFEEGGGSWIGIQTIRRVLRSAEGRDKPTRLVDVIKSYYQVDDVMKIIGIIYADKSVNIEKIAGLAKLVIQQSTQGDAIAYEIVSQAGVDLGNLTVKLLDKLNVPKDIAFPIFRIGNIWRTESVLTEKSRQIVLKNYPQAVWKIPNESPAIGAALMAQSMYYNEIF